MCFNHIRHLNRMLSGCRAEHGFKQRHKWGLLRDYSQQSSAGNVTLRLCTVGRDGTEGTKMVSSEREE